MSIATLHRRSTAPAHSNAGQKMGPWQATALVVGSIVGAVAEEIARETGARLVAAEDPHEGVVGVDLIYTDVWLSMGEPKDEWAERIDLLRPYRVDEALMVATRNPSVKFLHCLPAFHDDQTEVGAEVLRTMPGETCLEVSDAVSSRRPRSSSTRRRTGCTR